MKKSRLNNFNDYLALIVRRRWWVIIPTVILAGLAVLLTLYFPRMYVSQTMILIQQRDVPSEFVKDLIGGNTDERLSAIEQTILSRTNLLRILGEFENRLPEYRNLNDERKVAKLKKRISIDFPAERRRGAYLPTTNILINYRDRNPELAQKITARLASLFIEQDNKARENKVFGTAEFLEAELKKVADQLKLSETQLSALKQRYRYELPSQHETNMRTLDRLQLEKNSNIEAIDRSITLQMNLEMQISQTPPTIPVESAKTAAAAKNPLVAEYLKKEQEYNDLIAKAKPTHPDVRRLAAEMEQLKKDIPPEDLIVKPEGAAAESAPPAMAPNPVYQNLVGQLNQVKTEISIREQQKKRIENDMQQYSQRIQAMPAVEQQMLAITRANEDLTKQHDDLKVKLEEARLAGSLESRQKGAQFDIVDPANYPLEPAPPGRSMILLVGLAISLAGGLVCAVIANTLNQKVWTHHELERALNIPVLVEIPSITIPGDTRRLMYKRVVHVALFVIGTTVYAGGLYYLYLRQAPVLRLFDPLIEKIVERATTSV